MKKYIYLLVLVVFISAAICLVLFSPATFLLSDKITFAGMAAVGVFMVWFALINLDPKNPLSLGRAAIFAFGGFLLVIVSIVFDSLIPGAIITIAITALYLYPLLFSK